MDIVSLRGYMKKCKKEGVNPSLEGLNTYDKLSREYIKMCLGSNIKPSKDTFMAFLKGFELYQKLK